MSPSARRHAPPPRPRARGGRLVTTIVLLMAGEDAAASGSDPVDLPESRNIVNILNSASVLYLSGLAAAIGFRMNLFNIGVEGQYRVATFCAALFAARPGCPATLNTFATLLVAMLAGAAWAGIAGLLKVTRGVSEVISTIMLNAIAGSLIAYLLRETGSARARPSSPTRSPRAAGSAASRSSPTPRPRSTA